MTIDKLSQEISSLHKHIEDPRSADASDPGKTAEVLSEGEKSLGLQKITRFAWMPIPLLFLLVAVLSLGTGGPMLGLLPLLPVFNLAFLTLVCLLVAVLAARSYLINGSPTFLFLGSGVLAYGVTSLLASFSVPAGDYNTGATIYYLGVPLAGFLCLLSIFWLQASPGRRHFRPSPAILVATYAAALVAMMTIYLSATHGLLPTFFVEGVGPTALRQTMLGVAFIGFAGTTMLILVLERRNRSAFLDWYALGMALIAVGLLGAVSYKNYDSLLAWVGRGCHYLGGFYLLMALTAATRQSGRWMIPLTTLQETYDRHTRLVDASPDAILVLVKGLIAFANPSAARLFRVPIHEPLLGLSLLDLVHPASRSSVEDYLENSFSTEKSADALEAKMLQRDGSAVDVELVAVPVTDEGQPAVQMVLRDISERKRNEEALKESEAQLKEAQRLSKVGNWEWHIDGDIVTWSDELYDIAGLSRERPAPNYKEHPSFYTKESWDLLDRAVKKALDTGEPYELTLELIRADGNHRWIDAHGEAVRDAEGRTVGLRGTIQDVTERRRMEEELKESERKYRSLFENIQAIVQVHQLVFDEHGEVIDLVHVDANAASLKALGRASLDEIRGKRFSEVYSPEYLAWALDYIRKLKAKGGPITEEVHSSLTGKDSLVSFLEFGQDSVLVTAIDITERKRAEEALRESEDRFKAIFSRAALGLAITAPAGLIVDCNSAYQEMLGYSKEELQEKHFLDITHPDDVKRNVDLHINMLDGSVDSYQFEKRYIRRDGRAIWCNLVASAIRNSDGTLKYNMAVVEDITQRKQAEERIAYLASFPEVNPNPIFEVSLDGVVSYANPAADQLLPDLKAQGTDHPLLSGFDEILGDLKEGKSSLTRDVKFNDIFYQQSIFCIQDQRVLRFYNLDITERKRAEADIQRLAVQRQLALDAAKLGWWQYDPITRMTQWDDGYRAIFGVSGYARPNDEILQQIIHPEDLPGLWAKVEAALNPTDPQPFSTAYRINRPDGQMRWVEAHGTATFEGEGDARQAVNFVGTVQDITERRRLEEALKESEQKYRNLFENTQAIVNVYQLVFDEHSEVIDLVHVDANAAGLKEMGWASLDEIRGKRFSEVYSPEYLAWALDYIRKLKAKGGPITEEVYNSLTGKDWLVTFLEFGQDLVLITAMDTTKRKQAEDALRESEERARQKAEELEKLMDIVPAAIWIAQDPECRSITGNRTADEMYETVGGENVSAGTADGDVLNTERQWFKDGLKLSPEELPMQMAAARGEGISNYEMDCLLPSGRQITMFGNASPLFDDHGQVRGCVGAFLDITEIKRVERELRETQDYLNSLINYANAPIIVWDPAFNITQFNHAFERLSGYEAEEVIGKNLKMLFPPESIDESLNKIASTLLGDHWESVEIPILHKGGSTRIALWNSANIHSEKGELLATIAQGQDITERKMAEEALRESERRFRDAIDHFPNVFVIYDADRRIQKINSKGLEILGLSENEIIGRRDEDIFPPQMINSYLPALKLAVETKAPQTLERKRHSRLGDQIVAINIIPLLDGNREVRQILAISHDVSEHRRMEEELSRSNDDLEQRVAERTAELSVAKENLEAINKKLQIEIAEHERIEKSLMAAKDVVEAALRAKSEFLAVMSHELRTPLNGIMGMASLLEIESLSSEQRECVDAIKTSGESLLAVINDILTFAKTDSGKVSLKKKPFNLRNCINDAVGLLYPKAEAKGLDIACSIDRKVPEIVISDQMRLRQVLLNLLDNAIKFTDKGRIDISVSGRSAKDSKEEILFSIKDTGIGISKNDISKLFEPFSQVDMSISRKYGGTGLGLAISKGLVELLGGKIWVESDPGKGSTFHFTLITDQPHDVHTDNLEPALKKNTLEEGPKNYRVLLAEDNDLNRAVTLRMLKKLGYTADAVSSGREAVESLQRQHYDIVLMDVQMPDTDGLDATKEIRNLWPDNGPKIIALTAHTLEGDKERCIEAGMDDYIAKPVEIGGLAEVLSRYSL